VDVTDDEVVVLGPVVAVHLGFVFVDVVGEDDFPALTLQGEADEADAGEELGGAGFLMLSGSIGNCKAVFAVLKAFERDEGVFLDVMMTVEAADGAAVAEKAAGFASFGIAADVGGDGFVQAVKKDFDSAVAIAIAFGGATDVGRKEVEVPADVEVVLPQVSGGNLEKTFAIHCCRPRLPLESIRVWHHLNRLRSGETSG